MKTLEISTRLQAEIKWHNMTVSQRLEVIKLTGAAKINGIKGHRVCVEYVKNNLL